MSKLKEFLRFRRKLTHLILALILVAGLGTSLSLVSQHQPIKSESTAVITSAKEQNMSLLPTEGLVKTANAQCTQVCDTQEICEAACRPCGAAYEGECDDTGGQAVCDGPISCHDQPYNCRQDCPQQEPPQPEPSAPPPPSQEPSCSETATYCEPSTGTYWQQGGGYWDGFECVYNFQDTQQSCTGGGNEGDWCPNPPQPACPEGQSPEGTMNGIIQNGVCELNDNTLSYTCRPVSTGGQCPADETYCDGSTQIHKHGGYYDPNDPSADSAGCVYAYDSQGSCGETTQCTADETYCDNGTQIRKHGGYYDPNSPLADSSGCVFAFDATGQSCGSGGLGYGFCDNGVTKQCSFFCEGNLRYHDSPTGKQLESTCAQGEVCRGGPPEDPGGCFPGQVGTQATARPSPSSSPRPPGNVAPPPIGNIPIATIRPGATVAPGATIRPGTSASPGTSARPGTSASPGAGAAVTTHFRVAERIEDLDTAPWVPYTRVPMPYIYEFKDLTGNFPLTKNIYVEFRDSNGNISNPPDTKSIDIVGPDPTLTGISCKLDIGSNNIVFKLTGANFGATRGTIKADPSTFGAVPRTSITVSDWQDKLAQGTIPTPSSGASTGATYVLSLTLPDGRHVENTCAIGLSQLSLGAKLFCPQIADRDIKDVKVGLFEASSGGKVKRVTTNIDTKFAVIQNLKETLQQGIKYQACVDTPQTTRSCSEPFVGVEGTTILNMDPLRFGDIAGQGPGCPGEGEGVINSVDKACLNQQWGKTAQANKNCDCNNDGVCNSFEWGYMKNFFDKRDESEPKF